MPLALAFCAERLFGLLVLAFSVRWILSSQHRSRIWTYKVAIAMYQFGINICIWDPSLYPFIIFTTFMFSGLQLTRCNFVMRYFWMVLTLREILSLDIGHIINRISCYLIIRDFLSFIIFEDQSDFEFPPNSLSSFFLFYFLFITFFAAKQIKKSSIAMFNS